MSGARRAPACPVRCRRSPCTTPRARSLPGPDSPPLDAPARGGAAPGPEPSRGGAAVDAGPDFETWAAVRWSRLVRTAYLLTGDHHEAEDLVQTTLAKVYRAWPRISRLDEPDAYV